MGTENPGRLTKYVNVNKSSIAEETNKYKATNPTIQIFPGFITSMQLSITLNSIPTGWVFYPYQV